MNEFWPDLLRLLTLQDANTRTVLLGAGLLGLACGVIGVFAVLRRRALVGDAVAHAALPGVCTAYLLLGNRDLPALLLGALIFGLLGVGMMAGLRRVGRVKEDAAIGIVLTTFFGAGIVLSRLIQNQPGGNRAGLDGFIFGKAASMVQQDALVIGGVALVVIVTCALLFKEFKILCFDRGFASTQGWPATLLEFALLALLCICTVAGLPAVGVVLIVGLLIAPPVAARFWTDRLATMLLISGAIGLFSGLLGTALSAVLPSPPHSLSRGWPTGPLIALTAGACFVVSMLAAPRRGLIAEALRRRAVNQRLRDRSGVGA